MIDKKPYRVTNEQIRAEIICTQGDNCEGCPFYGYDQCDNLRGNDFDIYKDLLDARELIDKQEALLKEMRSMVEVVRDNTLNPSHTMTLVGLKETTDANHKLALSILEKTKEYI